MKCNCYCSHWLSERQLKEVQKQGFHLMTVFHCSPNYYNPSGPKVRRSFKLDHRLGVTYIAHITCLPPFFPPRILLTLTSIDWIFNHDSQIQQSWSTCQDVVFAASPVSASPTPGHKRWTLHAASICVLLKLEARRVIEKSLVARPAGLVGTSNWSALEMGPSGFLRVIRGPLAAVCLLVVLAGLPEWRPCSTGPRCSSAGAHCLREVYNQLCGRLLLLSGDAADYWLRHHVPQRGLS